MVSLTKLDVFLRIPVTFLNPHLTPVLTSSFCLISPANKHLRHSSGLFDVPTVPCAGRTMAGALHAAQSEGL